MAKRTSYFAIKPYLWHAVAATLSVIVLPAAVVLSLTSLMQPAPPMFLIALLGIVLSIGATAIGAGWWSRRIESTEIGFSDLMLWRWFTRRRAEDTLEEGARLLGLDRSGHPVDEVRITPEQQFQVLKDLTAALESKDPYTHGHSQRVERHSYRTAAAMHLSVHDIEDLRKAASLHDVGKIRVPDRVLRKPGQLTIEERVLMEEHAVVGAWMVSSVGNADVIAAVRHHHERWDGTGYPDGLAGSDIPLYARLVAVADAFDAITSTRPYRSSSGRDDAIKQLRAGAGTQFDPEVVEAFIAALPTRLPVTAGMFLLLGGAPQRLLRAFASWLKQLGAGSLSPAVGAAGAAVVLGASVFTPSIPAPVRERPILAQPAEADGSQHESDKETRVKGKRERREPKKAVARRERNRRSPVVASREESVVAVAETDRVEKPDPRPKPQPPEREPEAAPQPAPEPEESKGNPNDDRDSCHDDGNAGHGNDPEQCGGSRSRDATDEGRDVVNDLLDDDTESKGHKGKGKK